MKYLLIVDFQPGVDRHPDGGVEARGDRGAPRLLPGPRAGAREQRRAGPVGGPRRARPGKDRDLGRRHRAGRHRRPVPGVQGVDRRLPDRRRRLRGSGDRDRGEGSRPCRAQAVASTQQPIIVRQVMEAGPSNASRDGRLPRDRSGARRAERPAPDVEDLLRALAPQVLGTLARRSGDFDAAEDAVQEALIAAADHWPREGIPPNPRAWLHADGESTADRPAAQRAGSSEPRARDGPARADDAVGRRGRRHADRAVHVLPSGADAGVVDRADAARRRRSDDRRDREGLPGARGDDGPAHLAREADDQGLRRAVPDCRLPRNSPSALRSVLHVLYLMFNEGYASSTGQRAPARRPVRRGDPARHDGASRASGRCRGRGAPRAHAPHRCPTSCADECRGRPRSRFRTRSEARWDQAKIAEGNGAPGRRDRQGPGRRVPAAGGDRRHPRPGANRADDTDWPQILALYGLLEQMTGNPVVTLNRAVAAAMADGPSGRSGGARRDGRLAGRQPPPRGGSRAPARDGRRHRCCAGALPHRQRD